MSALVLALLAELERCARRIHAAALAAGNTADIIVRPRGTLWQVLKEEDLEQRVRDGAATILDRVKVIVNHKAARRWGLAVYNRSYPQIEYAAALEGTDPFLTTERRDTLLHEVAHFLTFYGFRRNGHGAEWKNCCRAVEKATGEDVS